ncbi:protoporphyrinogen oxidase [Streptomyces sp. NPDC049040]|uniref:protoporphyrinogen oxidase n=1 Tax=Streptomyces sp. NPDC049040 TaxID=3365593 RepID=UPI00371A7111
MSHTHSGRGAAAAHDRAAGPSAGPAGGHVVVVGGGISGLAAAHRLAGAGVRVTLLEASPRLGGKLHADEIAGVPVDLGAESILARRPEAVELAREVGLGDDLEPPAVLGATLWTRGRLRPMPQGHVMGVPGDLGPLAASGVLSAAGLARLPLDHVLPRTGIDGDVAVGAFVAARLGREVVDRLVEPLLGGVYAGNAYEISLRAAVPQLFAAAAAQRSLIEAARGVQRRAAAAAGTGPVFNGIRGGIGRLPLAVADACRAAGAVIETGAPVRELRRNGPHGWQVRLDDRVLDADAVVLAAPAPAAARLLDAESPAAAAELGSVDYAGMALVTMAYRRSDLARLPQSSGFLVPPVDGRTIKASTFSSRKWGWLDAAGGDTMVLRTSVGRYGDEADLAWEDTDLVRLSREDLAEAVGLRAAPVAARVTRWEAGLPQYPVGHLDRVARIREQVGKLPGLALCGALYDGVGIPACVGSGRRAAAEVLGTLVPGGAGGAGE